SLDPPSCTGLFSPADEAQDQERRHHDRRAEQEIAQEAVDRLKAHVPEAGEEVGDASQHILRRPAEGRHHHADEEGHHDQLERDAKGRVAEKAGECAHACLLTIVTPRYAARTPASRPAGLATNDLLPRGTGTTGTRGNKRGRHPESYAAACSLALSMDNRPRI